MTSDGGAAPYTTKGYIDGDFQRSQSTWNSTSGPLALGGHIGYGLDAGDYSLSGSIAEVIIYDHELSDGDRTTIVDYLCDKWGVVSGSYPY
jgi:hypothetical protein